MRKIKKFRYILSLLLVMILFIPTISVYGSDYEQKDTSYVITTYNDRNGLPTREANTILQTSDGYIWIGSYGGLIRFDGYQFTNYSTNGYIDSSSIRSLFEDSRGRLWIGTNDKGVIVLENNEFTHITGPVDNSFLCIRDITETSDGTIYISSNSGIAYISDSSVIPIDNEVVNGTTIYSISADCYDRLWFSGVSDQIGVLDTNGDISLYDSNDIFKRDIVYCLTCSGNKLYVGSNNNEYAEITLIADSTDLSKCKIELFDTGVISTHNKINISAQGDVLISGITGLYVKSYNGNIDIFTEDMSASSVNWALKDYQGNIWVASSRVGVTMYAKGYFYNTNLISGLGDIAFNTIVKCDDLFYIGCDQGLYICDSDWHPLENELTEELNGIRIRNIITDSKGNVWLATYAGVFCYNPSSGEILIYNTENGLINNRVRVLYELQDGNIAAGTQDGISFIGKNRVLENYTNEDGLTNPSILCMLQEEDGTLLCGSDGDGIYALKEGEVTNHGFSEGLAEGVVLRMLKDSERNGYFVSAGSSIYYWDTEANTFKKHTNWDKSAGSVFDMYERNGYIWMFQNKGILAVNKEQLIHDIPAETITYSFNHGLTGSLNANTWNYMDEDGDLYTVTRNGVCVFYFDEIKNSDPKGIISSIVVDGKIYDNPKEITLPSSTNRITVNFSQLSFSGTSTLTTSYILEGFDEEKTKVTGETNKSISYTNLPGGDYKFILQIYDSHNPNVVERYEVTIHKEKKLTEHTSFWVGLIILIVLVVGYAIYLLSRIKIKRLEKHNKTYHDIVEQALKTFAKSIDAKDAYTNGHSIRVAMYSREIAKRLKMPESEQERIYYIAMLHDIGKIGIPDNILNKPAKLTKEEMDIIQTHPAIGGDILKNFSAIPDISQGARYHHERYDGKGYCEGKKGKDIPLIARIIGVADSYDAMSSDRCYRKALSQEVIVGELKKASGTQLDPEIVPIMLEMIEDGTAPYEVTDN